MEVGFERILADIDGHATADRRQRRHFVETRIATPERTSDLLDTMEQNIFAWIGNRALLTVEDIAAAGHWRHLHRLPRDLWRPQLAVGHLRRRTAPAVLARASTVL